MKMDLKKYSFRMLIVGWTLMNLCLSACDSENGIGEDPYGGGKVPLGIQLIKESPMPDSGYPRDEVVFKAKGLATHIHGDGIYDFEFYLSDEKAEILSATDTTIVIRVPDNVCSGQTYLIMEGQVFYGPTFTVLGNIDIDTDYKLYDAVYAPGGPIYDYLEYINDGNRYYYVVGDFSSLGNNTKCYNVAMVDSRGNRMTHSSVTPFNISSGTLGYYYEDNSWTTMTSDAINSIQEFSDGRKLIAGRFMGFNGRTNMRNITVLNADLSVPTTSYTLPTATGSTKNVSMPTFNGNIFEEVVRAFVTRDQKVLAVGNFNQYYKYNYESSTYNYYEEEYEDIADVVLLDAATGDLDATFRTGKTGTEGIIYDACMDENYNLIIAGQFSEFDGVSVANIVRLNSSGEVDSFFPAYTNGNITRINYNKKYHKFVIVGTFTEVNGVARDGVAMLNEDGSLDETFAPRDFGNGKPNYAILLNYGKVLVAGTFGKYNGVSRLGSVFLELDGEALQANNVPGAFNGQLYQAIETTTTTGANGLLLLGDFTRFNNVPVYNAVMLSVDFQ